MNSNLTTHLRQAAHGVSAVGLFMSIGTQIFALSNHALPFLVWMILDREVYLPLIKPEQLKLGFGQWTAITLVSTTVGMAFAHVVDLAGSSLPVLLRLFCSAMLTHFMQGSSTGG